MYLRPVHTDLNLTRLYSFIRANPLGIFTTAIPSTTYPTIQSSHIPWVLDILSLPASEADASDEGPPAPKARLRGHLARANPQCKALLEQATQSGSNTLVEEVMILFNSPVHHYITPKFYTGTKPSTGKVVPTWDYAAVQVYGTVKLHIDVESEFLKKQLDDLSKQSEEEVFGFDGMDGREKPWTVDESPERFVALLRKAIIGLEVEVSRVQGKWKMSQELKEGDREGVLRGLESFGTEEMKALAEMVRERASLQKELKVGAA